VIRLSPAVVGLSRRYGAKRVLDMQAGLYAKSRQLSIAGSNNPVLQADARAAEAACAQRLGLDPLFAIDWFRTKADDGYDLQVDGLLIDVKSIPYHRNPFLKWATPHGIGFATARFDLMILAMGGGAEWDILGWISKPAFHARKEISDGSHLLAGTWYMRAADLWPMTDFDHEFRLPRLAIRMGIQAEHVMGRWP